MVQMEGVMDVPARHQEGVGEVMFWAEIMGRELVGHL